MTGLVPPKANWNDTVRTMLEKYLEYKEPFYGSLVTYAGRIFLPSTMEMQTKAWQEDVSNRVNLLENAVEKLSSSLKFSQLALDIGLYVSSESQDGIVEPYEIEKISKRFSKHTTNEIYEACGELENAGVCHIRQLINSAGYLVINVEFFFVFDPYVFSWHPALDTAKLSRKIVEITSNDQAAVSSELAEEFGWGARRFNPPLQKIVELVSEGRVGQGYTPPWVHRYLYTTPGERAALRELAHKFDGR